MMQSCIFSIITQSHMILQESFWYSDLQLKKHFSLLSTLKTVVLLNIFVETVIHIFIFYLKQKSFKTLSNVFNVTYFME